MTSRVTIECDPAGAWRVAIDGKLVGEGMPKRAVAECVRVWLSRHLLDVLTFPKNVTGVGKRPMTAPYRRDEPRPDVHGAQQAAQILAKLRGNGHRDCDCSECLPETY